ncbi:MAG: M6 family metalloprotease domain-containing protein [Candidatus Methanoperedens sp.]|nr:M6 family metalloprotease domain-containing protein [Candidatus Methanoperedens sp.]
MSVKTRTLAFLILLVTVSGTALGVPANPAPFILTQPDNTSFQAVQVGDERGTHIETLDGYTIIKDKIDAWKYARNDETEELVPTDSKVGEIKPGFLGLKKHLKKATAATGSSSMKSSPAVSKDFAASNTLKPAPAVGTKKPLVILINFTDTLQNSTHSPAYFDNLLFNSSQDARSLNSYYKEVSYGKMNINGTIAGSKWYSSSYDMAYYGKDLNGRIDNDASYGLICEAVSLASADTDYSQYDSNGDGYIDSILVIHAGNGQESSNNGDDIWSVYWPGDLCGTSTFNGMKVNNGIVAAESSPLGIFAHEFGHNLGLPDLYDSSGGSYGVGYWDIMGFGGWLDGGNTPGHLSAWSKYFLGWVNPIKVKTTLLNKQIDQSERKDNIYKLLDNPGDSPGNLDWDAKGNGKGEYFLIENRRKTGYDAYLPGEGLLIWHINQSAPDNNDKNYKLVDLEEADGKDGLDNKIDSGDAFDPWSNSASGFFEFSTPNSNLYDNSPSGIGLTDISASSASMTANLIVGWPPPMISIVSPNNGQVISTRSIVIKGTASDSAAVSKVEVKIGAGAWQTASGNTSWTSPVTLSAGWNTIYARAKDSSGNSNETFVTVNYTSSQIGTPNSPDGNDNGSSGGGWPIGKNLKNIKIREKSYIHNYKDKIISRFANITGNISAGELKERYRR